MTDTQCPIVGDDGVKITLRESASALSTPSRPFYVGAAVLPKPLFGNDGEPDSDPAPDFSPAYGRTLRSEFNAVVVEHHLKWTPLCHSLPGPLPGRPSLREGRYDFHHADHLVDWALARGLAVKGHVLVWHVTSPPFLEDLPPARFAESVRRHIFTTMGHFRGRIRLWDVVNESIAPDGTLADNVFLRKMGPGYVARCFRWAAEADPDALLYYNDNKVEGSSLPDGRSVKGDAFYELLRGMVEDGVPVHGAGLQCHFDAAGTGLRRVPHPGAVREQVRRLGGLGLRVHLSELDVRVGRLPDDEGRREKAQCEVYRDIVKECRKEANFEGVWLWGFTDKHTWVKDFYYGGKVGMDAPLIFDTDYKKKGAYYALLEGMTEHFGDKDKEIDWEIWGRDWMVSEPEQGLLRNANLMPKGDSRPDWIIEQEDTIE
uniref:endo-1,4-beta-xylanase n=1 Tax=Corethron hystrix TaxID=216773 RepID=A0A7S1C1R6_9STRA|mmetsp:Transcript_8905/g.19606  ORF Transcript_8905/g.19606 Transcript_8905/m.19606 type:complete len:430 (+) Transcript_8905:168-1457(+)|eukprot:CAMPEP_0113313912 /NCGR_PEP_ID=MMETSP0010_2-20120614/10160_1 /TAXON_ID=216773 ORGANISM="Corethron hystrix, Strain 308" /NCGR_SAMPLE_ID=MMETSP0010_2 /ASSEMBLY_ACC=CAM_ASM_000155 /LENGTH=429 /DNA_ID=CAMNT_0000170047 /DNA_START=92 /DNA_END=1381 /DNA_ORIENTATION=+ /assembly_acc=CAM_ASM_000155